MVFLNSCIITKCLNENKVNVFPFDVMSCIQRIMKDWNIDTNKVPSKIFIPMYDKVNKFLLFIIDFDKVDITICSTSGMMHEDQWKPEYDLLKYLLPRYFGCTEFIDWKVHEDNPMYDLIGNDRDSDIYICMWAYLLGNTEECEKYVHEQNLHPFIQYKKTAIKQEKLTAMEQGKLTAISPNVFTFSE